MTGKMDPEVKGKWLTALRSGEYEQGKGYLKVEPEDENDKPKYCCLGVLCDVAIKSGLPLDEETVTDVNNEGYELQAVKFNGNQSFLPPQVQDWAGMDGDGWSGGDPTVITKYGEEDELEFNISVLNDGENYDFNALADLIEAQL